VVSVDERLIDVAGVCQKFSVQPQTVYRWFKAGLEYGKWGGKALTSLEALQRFSRQSDDDAVLQLRQLGIVIGSEARTDGCKTKTKVPRL
jgi:hypothetical protein